MKRYLLPAFLLCLYVLPAAAIDSLGVYWQKAHTAYKAKQYDVAARYYEDILSAQPMHAAAYYNLGNAYYKSNNVSKAVLNYERALFYDPGMTQAQDNLLLAKSRIPNAIRSAEDIFFVRWWHSLTSGNTTNTWAIISLITFLILLGAILLPYSGKRRVVPAQFFFFTPLVLLLFLFCAYISANNATYSSKAVVMGRTAAFVTAPGVYKGQSIIPEATTVATGATAKGGWIAVTLPDNRSGWMQQTELTFVHPLSRH